MFKKDFSGIPFILWAIKPDSEAPRMQQTSATSMTNKDEDRGDSEARLLWWTLHTQRGINKKRLQIEGAGE